MTTLDYEEIFSSFLGNVTDYNLASLNPTDTYELLKEYLHKALAESYVSRLFATKDLDDTIQVFSFELKRSQDEDSDKLFVITAITKWMIYEWYQDKVNSSVNVIQFFGTKEQKMYAQSTHMTSSLSLQKNAYDEAYRFIMRRGYIDNSYLEGKKS